MMSLMTSQREVKFGLQYSCFIETVTFSGIQVVVLIFDQSSSNFTHICSLAQHVGMHFSRSKVKELRHKVKK